MNTDQGGLLRNTGFGSVDEVVMDPEIAVVFSAYLSTHTPIQRQGTTEGMGLQETEQGLNGIISRIPTEIKKRIPAWLTRFDRIELWSVPDDQAGKNAMLVASDVIYRKERAICLARFIVLDQTEKPDTVDSSLTGVATLERAVKWCRANIGTKKEEAEKGGDLENPDATIIFITLSCLLFFLTLCPLLKSLLGDSPLAEILTFLTWLFFVLFNGFKCPKVFTKSNKQKRDRLILSACGSLEKKYGN